MPFSPDFLMSQIKGGQSLKTDSFKQAQDMVKTDVLGDYAAAVSASDQEYNLQELNLSKNLNSLLSTGAGLESYINDTPFTEKVGKILSEPGSLSPFGSMDDIGVKISHLPNLSKDEGVIASVALFQDVINKGSSQEIDKALKDLRTTFQKTFSKLNPDGRDELARSYKQIVNFANAKAKIKMATEDLDAYLANVDFNIRNQQLEKYNPQRDKLAYQIAAPGKDAKTIQNQFADLESNIYGSKLYNDEDLEVFKSTPYNPADRELYARFDLDNAYSKQSAVRSKISSFQQNIADIDKQIKNTINPQEKTQLAAQKVQLNNEISFLKNLDNKLNNETNSDAYLKKNYPEVYAKEKYRQSLEMVKNRNYAQGDEVQWLGSNGMLWRGIQQTGSNWTNFAAGISHLVGAHRTGYDLRSTADSIAPPNLYMGTDINKNNKIDPNEIQKDIYGEDISFNQFRFQYKDKSGKLVDTWNLQTPLDSVIPIAVDVAVSYLIGVNSTPMTSMISTAASTFVTQFPRMYAEERSLFKDSSDALAVSTMRAIVESLSETITPDASFFRGTKVTNALDKFIDPALEKIGKKFAIKNMSKLSMQADELLALLPPNAISKLDAFKIIAPTAIKQTLSAATQESIEELASLVGNHVIDEYAAKASNFEFESYNELNTESVLDTFVEGFIPSLFISGAQVNTPIKATQRNRFGEIMRDDQGNPLKRWQYAPAVQRTEQARWNIATNPEMYKQSLARQREAGKITREEEIKRVAGIERLSNKYNQMASELDNIRDIYGLATDREKQFEYFNNILHEEDMLGVDPTNFTPEELADYEKMTATVNNEILSVRNNISKYKKMTDQEKEMNLKKVFADKMTAVENATMGSVLDTLTMLNPSLTKLNEKDDKFDLLKSLYAEYKNATIQNLNDRVDNFAMRLSSDPASITNLELMTFTSMYGPLMSQLSKVQGPSMFAEQTEIPFLSIDPLLSQIKDELEDRKTYTSDAEFIEAASKNLKNLEVGKMQSDRLALAQLTQEEIESGEVNRDLHDNLTKEQIFNLALALNRNTKIRARSGKNPLVKQVENIRNNDYFFTKNADGTFDLAKIKDANIKATQLSEQIPANTSMQGSTFNPPPAPPAPPVPPAPSDNPGTGLPGNPAVNPNPDPINPDVNPDEEPPSTVDEEEYEINAELYNTIAKLRADFLTLLNASNLDEESIREETSNFNNQILKEILEQNNLVDVFTILAAAFGDVQANNLNLFNSYILSAANNKADKGLLASTSLAKPFVTKIHNHVTKIMANVGAVNPGAGTNNNNSSNNTPSEKELEEDNKNNSEDIELSNSQIIAQQQLRLERMDGDFDLALSMTNVDVNNKSLMSDPFVAFSHKVLQQFSNAVRRGASPAYKVIIDSAQKIYERVLSIEDIEQLNQFKTLKRALNPTEAQTLRRILSNGAIPLANSGALDYLVSKPSQIGTGILALVTDSELKPVLFTDNGMQSTGDGTPLLLNLKTTKHFSANSAEKQLYQNAERIIAGGGHIVTNITGVASPATVPAKAAGKYQIYLHTENDPAVVPTEFGEFILNKGYAYAKDDKNPHKYQYIKLPFVNIDFLIESINAFNAGTLPESFPEEYKEDAQAFIDYLNQLMFFSHEKQGLKLTNNNAGKVVFQKKSDKNGKFYQITGSPATQRKTIEESLSKVPYSINSKLLEANPSFDLLMIKDGQLVSKRFDSYDDMLRSDDFGATIITRANASFALSPNLEVNDSVAIADLLLGPAAPALPPLPNPVDSLPPSLPPGDSFVSDIETTIQQARQLNLFEDQPLATPEQIAAREAREAEEWARLREEAESRENDYHEYLLRKEGFGDFGLPPIAQALENVPISRESFIQFSDKGILVGRLNRQIPKAYFAKDGRGLGIDVVADEASSIAGYEITPNDIIDFILEFPSGIGSPRSKSSDTFYGRMNPDLDPKYDNIRDLIKKRRIRKTAQKNRQDVYEEDDYFGRPATPVPVEEPTVPVELPETDPFDFPNGPLDNIFDDPETDLFGEAPEGAVPDDFIFRKLELGNEITEAQNEAAEDWVNNHPIFKATPLIFERTLFHPQAYAVWSRAGITLYADANYAEAYHEAWHEFTQMYLEDSQFDNLYEQAKKVYGDLPIGELEEKLAESFRQFALTNGETLPKEIKDWVEAKTLFEKVWDFLKSFFQNKQTIDRYFKELYTGQIDSYVRNPDRRKTKPLFSSKLVLLHPDKAVKVFNFRDSQKILTQLDSLFVSTATDLGETYGFTLVDIVENKKNTKGVLKEMHRTLYNTAKFYKEKSDANPTPAATRKSNYLMLLLSNANTLFEYYQANSPLFNDKIKSIAINDLVEETINDTTNSEFANIETSVNDHSQKITAHPLVISAIKSLPLYKNRRPVKDTVFNVDVVGNFDTNWNILQRGLAGSNTYEEMYDKLKEIIKDYPQFKKLLPYLPKPTEANIKRSTMNFKNAFFSTFSKPYIGGYISKINTTVDELGEKNVDFSLFKAQSSDARNLSKLWDAQFSSEPGPYKLVDQATGSYYLNLPKLLEDYPKVAGIRGDVSDAEATKIFIDQMMPFLKAVGFNFSENGVLALYNLSPLTAFSLVNYVRNKMQDLSVSPDLQNIYQPMTALLSSHTNPEGKVVLSEQTSVFRLIGAEIANNLEFVNDMYYNAINKRVWSVNPHTYMTKIVSVLNDAVNYPTLLDIYQDYPQLNPEHNLGGQGSFVLKYLFDINGNRRTERDGSYRTVEIANLLGIQTNYDGVKTSSATNALKHYTEIEGFLSKGVEEINRLSGKSTTRSLVLPESLRYSLGFEKSFGSDNSYIIPSEVITELLLPAIYNEVQVAKHYQENGNVFLKGNPFLADGSPRLTYFETIYDNADFRKRLYEAFKDVSYANLVSGFKTLSKEDQVELISKFRGHMLNLSKESNNILAGEFEVAPHDLLKYHTFSFFARIEQFKLFFGHPLYYKDAKDIEKRLSAWNAYGEYAVIDAQNSEYLRNQAFAQRDAFITHNQELGEGAVAINTEVSQSIDKINYIVLKDNAVNSQTAAESSAYTITVTDPKTKREVQLRTYYVANDDAKAQDAAAFATLDFYARFYALSTGVTEEMRKEIDRQNRIYDLYLKTSRGLPLQADLEAALNEGPYYVFNIRKLQYAGHNLADNGKTVPIFHKYSVKPILPSEVINNPQLGDILQKLHASTADYAVFKSGTKIAELKNPIDLYDKEGNVNPNYIEGSVGQIDMRYLKEQVLVENKETFMNIFSSQFRKLLFKDVQDENNPAYQKYLSAIENLVDFDKIKFLDNISDQEKVVEFILKELNKKNISEATKDLIELDADGNLKLTLDSFVDRTIMETTMVSSLKNAVIKQKTPGAQRVQYPVSVVRPGRKLKYYDVVNGKLKRAEAIVSFSKGYFPLLNLIYNGKKIGEVDQSGKVINPHTTLTTLNKALQDPVFRKANETVLTKALTMTAIRIPGQDYNSMESFEIAEFLPMESGEIILVPDEMVVKSGSDFDIDKLFCYDPYLEDDASFVADFDTDGQTAYQIQKDRKNLLLENKQVIQELKGELNILTTRVAKIIEEYGFDPEVTKLKDLYVQLRGHRDEVVEDDSLGELTKEELAQALKESMSGGKPKTKKQEKQKAEITKTIDNIKKALSTAYKENLSEDIAQLTKHLSTIHAENALLLKQIQATRGRLTNALLESVAERLENPEIFKLLLRPNSADTIKALAAKYGERTNLTKASYTNIVNPLYQLYVHSLNSYKSALGAVAKMNVLHSILQKAGLIIIDPKAVEAYPIPANGLEQGIIDLSQVYGVDGSRIGDVNGEMISAQVDIEKEDEIAWINFNIKVTPTANYMFLAGSKTEDVTRLINLRYKDELDVVNGKPKSKRSSIIIYSRGRAGLSDAAFAKEIIAEMYEKGLEVDPEANSDHLQLISDSLDKYGEVNMNQLKENVAEYIKAIPTAVLEDETNLGNLVRFVSFLSVKDQQQKLLTLSSNTDFDTFSPVNFESFRRGANDLRTLLQENFFNRDGAMKVINSSVVSPFQIQKEIFQKFAKLFPISANEEIATFITTAYSTLKKINYTLDYDRFSRTFKNDLLYALFRNNIAEVADYEELLDKRNPANIAALYQSLKGRLAQRGIASENLIFDGATFNTEVDSSYIRPGYASVDSDNSINLLREDFETGLNWSHEELDPNNEDDMRLQEDMQSFFLAYAYTGIIGSQLNKKFDSYLPYIPESIYTRRMQETIQTFVEQTTEDVAKLSNGLYNYFLKKDAGKDTAKDDKKILSQILSEDTDAYTEKTRQLMEDKLFDLLKKQDSFISKFAIRFIENHPEFTNKRVENRDLLYFKDYDLSRDNIIDIETQASAAIKAVKQIKLSEEKTTRVYTPKEVTQLEPNQVYVFGANTVGHHGAGAAGYAMRGNARADYELQEPGTVGKWTVYGAINQLTEGTEGKSFPVVTKSANIVEDEQGNKKLVMGGKRSVSIRVIEDSILKMFESAKQNPELEYLVTELGVRLAGWNPAQIRSIFVKHIDSIPENVVLPKIFEVRDLYRPTTLSDVASQSGVELIPENFEQLRDEAIKSSFKSLAQLNQEFKNHCGS